MKLLWLLVVLAMACSPRPATKLPAFNVVCLSQGDTLFASDSVFAYTSPEQKW